MGKTITGVLETLNTNDRRRSSQNMGVKIHFREGNSPDYKLRS